MLWDVRMMRKLKVADPVDILIGTPGRLIDFFSYEVAEKNVKTLSKKLTGCLTCI